jgi:hypothetical protein
MAALGARAASRTGPSTPAFT